MIYRHKCYEKCHNQGNFWRKSKKITLENQGLEKSEKEKMKRRFIFLCLGFVMVKWRLVLSVRDRGLVVA